MLRSSAAALALILLVAMVPPEAGAHTGGWISVVCPVCKTRNRIRVTVSYTTFGAMRDFEQTGAVGTLYQDMVATCPTCHYSWYSDDFEKPVSAAVTKRVVDQLQKCYPKGALDGPTACEVAAEIAGWRGEKELVAGQLCLVGSYVARRRDPAVRKRLQQEVADHFERGLARGEVKGTNVAALSYLIGEMYRRLGKFDRALSWYDRALHARVPPRAHLLGWIKDQIKMARAGEANNDL